MRAMILAAGRGERMRPLTDSLPKPLLEVGGKPLIVYHLEKLAQLGVVDVIINIAYQGKKLKAALGNGQQWGLSIQYSEESEPLETGGALYQALPLLGDKPFLLINGDVWTDLDFSLLSEPLPEAYLGRLLLVNNPQHNTQGDFSLDAEGCLGGGSLGGVEGYLDDCLIKSADANDQTYTFSGLACFHPNLIHNYPEVREIFPLREVFHYFMAKKQLLGQVYTGQWHDVGTPERLRLLDEIISSNNALQNTL